MKITKAVITAAGKGQGDLPLQTLVDADGQTRSALEIILREALDAGIREVALVVRPADEESYRQAAGDCAEVLQFVHQREALGYAHALFQAREFVGGESFLHLVGDHLYVSNSGTGCARQLVEVAEAQECTVSAVQATRETNLHLYGTVGGQKLFHQKGLYEVECVREKPTPTLAEQELIVPGLRAGHYLCFFGMHVFSPGLMSVLESLLSAAESPQEVQLSDALNRLCSQEKYLACEVSGDRQNIGMPYGLFYAQLALALRGVDRDTVLAEMLSQLANRFGAPR
ncbi:MAG: sugar phosphate nucleotidyltransferase [Kiritimatiellia bacterium]